MAPTTSLAAADRLRASPNFALTFTLDGRPYVAKDSEPYIQYWLTERDRILLSLFSGRGGAEVANVVEAYFRLTGLPDTKSVRSSLARAIIDMRSAGVLIRAQDEMSRYDADIVSDYLLHRPFPPEVAARMIADGVITRSSRVLDLAGGPGDLAVQLAKVAGEVSLMELSGGFLKAARMLAKRQGVAVTTVHDSANRLVFRDDTYDVISVAQALHWLDDVAVCRGICRALQPCGSFFVIHGAMRVSDRHPLSHLFGHRSILGEKPDKPFGDEVAPLLRRLSLLFEALDTPDVDRIDLARRFSPTMGQIRPVHVSLFRQDRPLGPGFARAFLTPAHIAATGQDSEVFWNGVDTVCASATARDLIGTCEWALLQFRRGGEVTLGSASIPADMEAIGYDGPEGG